MNKFFLRPAQPRADILQTILARKAEEVAARSAALPLAEVAARAADMPAPRGFAAAIEATLRSTPGVRSVYRSGSLISNLLPIPPTTKARPRSPPLFSSMPPRWRLNSALSKS